MAHEAVVDTFTILTMFAYFENPVQTCHVPGTGMAHVIPRVGVRERTESRCIDNIFHAHARYCQSVCTTISAGYVISDHSSCFSCLCPFLAVLQIILRVFFSKSQLNCFQLAFSISTYFSLQDSKYIDIPGTFLVISLSLYLPLRFSRNFHPVNNCLLSLFRSMLFLCIYFLPRAAWAQAGLSIRLRQSVCQSVSVSLLMY